MIVISGALVLVALVLLVIGIVGTELGFVYASIVVSLVSLVFLVIGILQRRGETLPGTAEAGATPPAAPPTEVSVPGESVTTVIPTQASRTEVPPVADSADEELELGGTVLVVAGRPRYHVAGCRYLSGKDAEAVDVLDAREEGFTPCGVCKPDDALAALAEEEGEFEDEQAYDEVEPEPAPEPEPVRATSRKAPAKKAPAPARTRRVAEVAAPIAEPLPAEEPVAPVKAPRKTAAKAAPAKAAPAKAPAKKAASTAALLAAESTPAATTAKRTGSVVVIPERGRFHRAECRYVRGVEGSSVMTKAAATKAGYDACGVCKP